MDGVSRSNIQSFGTEAEAKSTWELAVMNKMKKCRRNKSAVQNPETSGDIRAETANSDAVEIYVDGSYHVEQGVSYGMVVLIDGKRKNFLRR